MQYSFKICVYLNSVTPKTYVLTPKSKFYDIYKVIYNRNMLFSSSMAAILENCHFGQHSQGQLETTLYFYKIYIKTIKIKL